MYSAKPPGYNLRSFVKPFLLSMTHMLAYLGMQLKLIESLKLFGTSVKTHVAG